MNIKDMTKLGVLVISLVFSAASMASPQVDIAHATTVQVNWHGGSGPFG